MSKQSKFLWLNKTTDGVVSSSLFIDLSEIIQAYINDKNELVLSFRNNHLQQTYIDLKTSQVIFEALRNYTKDG